MKALLTVLCALASSITFSQDYKVSAIPDSLRENADAVKRYEELRVIIKSPSKAVIRHKWAVTILNEEGFMHSWYYNAYNKLQSLDDISGNLFDSEGKHLKSIKKKEISDLSGNDEGDLMSGNRIKRFNFYYKQYPYTVEFEDEITLNGILFLPIWNPVRTYKFSVQHSQLVVEAPADYLVRFKQYSLEQPPKSSVNKDEKTLSWNLLNYKAVEREPYEPRNAEITPVVKLTPSNFEIEGYKGNMDSWQSLGKFFSQLIQGRDQLPPAIIKEVEQLTAGISSTEEKVNALYKYLQQNTRYISVQLGIGGWQPFDANYVATKRYGDCKALSNYMISLLKAAGIKSNYVLITAGEGDKGLEEDFPSPYFNHAIMCVPGAKDTLWLECTDQTRSPGFMGSFTGGRKALMITEEGGVVVSTPYYRVEDNIQVRKVTAMVDPVGNLVAEVKTRFTGQQQELQHDLIHSFTSEEREKYLNQVISLPTYKVEASDYKEYPGKIPAVDEYLKITSPNYASVTGKRLFIQPNLFSKSGTKLNTDKPRKFPIEFTFAFRDVDTMYITVPAGYRTESVPKDVSLSTKFGKYQISMKVVGDRIEVYRSYERADGVFPATDFKELAKFFEDIYKADRTKIVLIKNE